MTRLLRLFAAFRALEQDRDATVSALRETVQELTAQNLRLQDRVDFSEQDRAKLWDAMQGAQAAKDYAYQCHINVQWNKEGRPSPYPEVPGIPQQSMPHTSQEPITRRELPSEAIARRRNAAHREFAERLTPQ